VLADPEAWLYRVAVNLVRSRWRRLRVGRRVTARLAAGVGRLDDPPAPSGPAQVDARLLLLAALRRLPFEQREALALHYLADLPVADVAARVGAPVGTVKARLSRGRDALARFLAEDGVRVDDAGVRGGGGDV
jgi:RNA polymerase sigma-70 factor (ECF subfamily)